LRVYVAGKWEARPRLAEEGRRLERQGFTVVSSWLWREEQDVSANPTLGADYATIDLAEVSQASMLILDTIDENHRGGREVEYGYAKAKGHTCIIIGPQRNLFHHLAAARFVDWNCFFVSPWGNR
jgi:hypothetical protein